MKKRTTTMIVATVLAALAPTTFAKTDHRAERARELYKMGVTAMQEGNFDLAKTSFREVLRLYPNHPQARKQLLYISSNRNSLEIGKRKKALRQVLIPRVEIEKATINEALEMLAAQIEHESGKKVMPNFIVQDPTGAFKGRTVTLRLSRIPAETLLRYIADQAGGNIRYDNHAIVVTPKQHTRPSEQPEKEKQDDDLFAD